MAKKTELNATSAIAAPAEICELVEKFAEHRETYRRAGYNETQLRQDFLDPFFSALGFVEAKKPETLNSIAVRRKMNTLENRIKHSSTKKMNFSRVLEMHEGAGGGRRNH